jgi:hypothetical protein
MMQTGNRSPRSDIENPRPIIQRTRAGTPPGGGLEPFLACLRIATGMSLVIRFSGSIEDRRDRTLAASDTDAPGSAPDDECEGAGFNVAVLVGGLLERSAPGLGVHGRTPGRPTRRGRCWPRSMRGRTSVT